MVGIISVRTGLWRGSAGKGTLPWCEPGDLSVNPARHSHKDRREQILKCPLSLPQHGKDGPRKQVIPRDYSYHATLLLFSWLYLHNTTASGLDYVTTHKTLDLMLSVVNWAPTVSGIHMTAPLVLGNPNPALTSFCIRKLKPRNTEELSTRSQPSSPLGQGQNYCSRKGSLWLSWRVKWIRLRWWTIYDSSAQEKRCLCKVTTRGR